MPRNAFRLRNVIAFLASTAFFSVLLVGIGFAMLFLADSIALTLEAVIVLGTPVAVIISYATAKALFLKLKRS